MLINRRCKIRNKLFETTIDELKQHKTAKSHRVRCYTTWQQQSEQNQLFTVNESIFLLRQQLSRRICGRLLWCIMKELVWLKRLKSWNLYCQMKTYQSQNTMLNIILRRNHLAQMGFKNFCWKNSSPTFIKV